MKRHLSGVKLQEGHLRGPSPRRGRHQPVPPDVALATLAHHLTDRRFVTQPDYVALLAALLNGERDRFHASGIDQWSDDPRLQTLVEPLTLRVWAITKAVNDLGYTPVWNEGAARLLPKPGKPLIVFVDNLVRRVTPCPAVELILSASQLQLDVFNTLSALALYIDAACDDLATCAAIPRTDALLFCWGNPNEL